MTQLNTIKLIRTKIEFYLKLTFIESMGRRLFVDNHNSILHLEIRLRNEDAREWCDITVFEVEVRNSIISSFILTILDDSFHSYGRFRFFNTTLRDSRAVYTMQGILSFMFRNCSFTGFLNLQLQRVRYFSLFKSTINLTNGCKDNDCRLRVIGDDAMHTCMRQTNNFFDSHHPTVYIQNSEIQCGFGQIFTVTDAYLTISESTFNISSDKSSSGYLINLNSQFHWNIVELENTVMIFIALDYEIKNIGIMAMSARDWKIRETQILCPVRMKAVKNLPTSYVRKRFYYCQEGCNSNAYTFQMGNMVLHGDSDRDESSLVYKGKIKNHLLNLPDPMCKLCPVGANCSINIKALPNYWSIRNKDGDVTMVRCPEGYCCQDDESCQSINSCNNKRSGLLCGSCKDNFTESLFGPTCVPLEECHTKLIIMLYILCVIACGMGLMLMDVIKDSGVSLLKKLYLKIKSKLSKKSMLTTESEPIEKSENKTKEDGGMKYLQILFYYVQDASLFKIHLPSIQLENTSTFVKILQFSPKIITSLYTTINNLCFSLGTTAVIKILFESFFGPCVMLFLFLIYLIEKVSGILKATKSKFRNVLKEKLVQTFVLVALLSYQQIVIGAFTLVKCIDIGNMKILYVQGDIQCFTQWQIVIEILICLSIIPFFFVLSSTPYYVQKKEMSVQMFILVCLFPIPGLLIFHLLRACKTRTNSNVLSFDIELNIPSNESGSPPMSESGTSNNPLDENPMGFELSKKSSMTCDTLGQFISMSVSDTDIGSEYSTDISPVSEIEFLNENKVCDHLTEHDAESKDLPDIRKGIIHSLLRHYKEMKLFGISFTWLGVHKIYRVVLVACNTYITDSIMMLSVMTGILLCVAFANSMVKPYKDHTANITASLSYLANCIIAVINLIKAVLSKYGCQINCSDVEDVVWYLDKAEEMLLIYVPIAAIILFSVVSVLQRCCKKKKE